MPIIPQTLNINNLKTTSARSINLHTIRKLIKYSLKNALVIAMFTLILFEILLFEGKLVLSAAQPAFAVVIPFKLTFLVNSLSVDGLT